MGGELIVVGGTKPQLRKASDRSWSKAKGREFLRVLGETLNVSEACRVSGLSSVVAYRRRKSDAGFRAAWAQMISEAYQKLHLLLLERAFTGTEKVIRRRDGSEERMRVYPDDLALRLLRMHRETAVETDADADTSAEELGELRERLMRKLKRLKARNDSEEAQPRGLRNGEGCAGASEQRTTGSPGESDQGADGRAPAVDGC